MQIEVCHIFLCLIHHAWNSHPTTHALSPPIRHPNKLRKLPDDAHSYSIVHLAHLQCEQSTRTTRSVDNGNNQPPPKTTMRRPTVDGRPTVRRSNIHDVVAESCWPFIGRSVGRSVGWPRNFIQSQQSQYFSTQLSTHSIQSTGIDLYEL